MKFKKISDYRGSLYVSEVPDNFTIRRVFWIEAPKGVTRGQHGHFKNNIFMILQMGKVKVNMIDQKGINSLVDLADVSSSIFIPSNVWHSIDFVEDSLLLCLNSHSYDSKDYF